MRHQWNTCFQFDIMYNYSSKTWIIIICSRCLLAHVRYIFEILWFDIYFFCLFLWLWSMQLKISAPLEYIENNRENAYICISWKIGLLSRSETGHDCQSWFQAKHTLFLSLSNLLNHLRTIHVPCHIPDTKSRHNPKSCVGMISWDSVGEMGQLQRVVGGMAKFGHVIFHFHNIYI